MLYSLCVQAMGLLIVIYLCCQMRLLNGLLIVCSSVSEEPQRATIGGAPTVALVPLQIQLHIRFFYWRFFRAPLLSCS